MNRLNNSVGQEYNGSKGILDDCMTKFLSLDPCTMLISNNHFELRGKQD